MEVEVKRVSDNEIVIVIEGEDDTIGNLIAKSAVQHPNVVYATYRIPHPLERKVEIIISVDKNADLGATVSEIINSIKSQLEEFKKKIDEVL